LHLSPLTGRQVDHYTVKKFSVRFSDTVVAVACSEAAVTATETPVRLLVPASRQSIHVRSRRRRRRRRCASPLPRRDLLLPSRRHSDAVLRHQSYTTVLRDIARRRTLVRLGREVV